MSEKRKNGYWRRKDRPEVTSVPPAADPRSPEETGPAHPPIAGPGESGGWALDNFDPPSESLASPVASDEPASGPGLGATPETGAPEQAADTGHTAAETTGIIHEMPSSPGEWEAYYARRPDPSEPGAAMTDDSLSEPPPGLRASPDLAWLNEDDGDDGWRGGAETAADADADADAAAAGPTEPPKGSRKWPMAGALLVLVAITGYLALTPKPTPRSAALEAERGAVSVPGAGEPEIGSAEPLPPTPSAEPASPELASAGDETPSEAEAPEEGAPAGEPMVPEHRSAAPAPAEESPAPASRTGRAAAEATPTTPPAEALALIVRKLEAQQALIERLERSEQVLRDRLEGLEIHAENEAARPEHPARPAPVSRKPKPNRVPPETTSLPVKNFTQRRSAAPQAGAPLPFSVESVDRLNGEAIVVVRAGGRLVDLKPGDSHGGWRIESAAGQTVTVRSPEGGERTVQAGGGSAP